MIKFTTKSIILGIVLIGAISCEVLKDAFALTEDKITQVKTTSPLEKYFSAMGAYAVKSVKQSANDDNLKEFTIYYPEGKNAGEKFPLVVMVNGTGVPASEYEPVLKHLASWGFVVIGSEEESSWSGTGASQTLDYILKLNEDKNSFIYHKINADKIGVSGHSQGGVGAINLANNQSNSNLVKTVYTASTTRREGEKNLFEFSPWKVRQPYFSVAGDGPFDQKVAPIASLLENQSKKPQGTSSVVAQRKGQDHGAMLYISNGYMVAWFLYTLNGDPKAKEVFAGNNAEILKNNNWQQVRVNNLK